jgi:hypothetical protein
MKTLADYLNRPEIADEPMAHREVHAIRLMQQDETKDMTPEQRREYAHKKAMTFLVGSGHTPQFVDLSGRGRVRHPVTT